MFGFLIRRVIAGLSVVAMVMVLAFGLFFLGPADPALQACGDRGCSDARLAEVRESMSLDEPVPEQFYDYVAGIFAGRDIQSGGVTKDCPAPCLGYSFKFDQPVTEMIMGAIPVTVFVAVGGMIVFLAIGIPSGAFAAIHRGTLIDKLLVGGSLTITSFPYYLVALLAAIYLTIQFQIFPRGGYVPPWEDPLGFVSGMVLAWLVLGLFYSTAYARYTRAAMVEVLGEDYVRTARAKGLPRRKVHFRHALRSSLTSVFTILGIDLAGLLTGTIFTERIFNLKGLGNMALDAFKGGDLPVIMGTVIWTSALLVTMNLIIDFVYSFLDPRVRLG